MGYNNDIKRLSRFACTANSLAEIVVPVGPDNLYEWVNIPLNTTVRIANRSGRGLVWQRQVRKPTHRLLALALAVGCAGFLGAPTPHVPRADAPLRL